jgi:hypothetical protein
MKKYLEDLRNELMKKNLTSEEIEEIISDHVEMIGSAIDDGLSEEEIIEKFGDPKKLAEAISDFEEFEQEEKTVEKVEVSKYRLWKSFEPTGKFLKVNVRLVSEKMIYQSVDVDDIEIHVLGEVELDKYELTYENDTLTIDAPRKIGLFFMQTKKEQVSFLILLPEHLVIDDFSHTTINSDVQFLNLKAKDFVANTTNGDMIIKDASLGDVKWHTVNGDIDVYQTKMNSLNTSHVSGDVVMHLVNIEKEFKMNTVSGDMKIKDSTCDHLELNTVSGDLKGLNFYPKSITLKSVSGDIDIKNKVEKEIVINKKKSISGKIRIH